jgi:uncharacterized protein
MNGGMEFFWICATTFLASGLTLFSGFGLGTILMPVVAIFLPVPVAIAITAIVHLMSKIFKLLLFWRYVDIKILMAFGIPAMIAAIPGAFLLEFFSRLGALGSYELFDSQHVIYPVKLVAGLLLILFATADQLPLLKNHAFLRMGMPVGGLLSGFFGGLTGHQGAFRSAFLIQGELSERSFVATNAAVAALVDATRLIIYGVTFDVAIVQNQSMLITATVISSFLGVFLAAELLKKVTIRFIQILVAVMMYALGFSLCVGLI